MISFDKYDGLYTYASPWYNPKLERWASDIRNGCLRDLVIDDKYFADCGYKYQSINDYIDYRDIKISEISDHEYSSESFQHIIQGTTA